MKIRNKIALIFLLLTSGVLLILNISIYYFASRYTENEFYKRLKERSNIVAQAFLEKDEVTTNIYNDIRKKHLQILPNEQEKIYRVNISTRIIEDSLLNGLPIQFFNQIFDKGYAEFQIGKAYHYGILYSDNEGDFIVIVTADDQYGESKLKNLLTIIILGFIFSTGVVYFLGLYYAKQVLKPVSDIIRNVNNIGASNLNLRLNTGNNKDELSELATTFNNMLDRLETSFQIQNNFVSNASHELRNPLTAIIGEAEYALRKSRKQEEYIDSLNTISSESQKLEILTTNLLKLAQTSFDNKKLLIEKVRIDELLIEIKNDTNKSNPKNNVILDFSNFPEQSDLLNINGSPNLLKVAFTNIIDNASKFSMNKEVIVRICTSINLISVEISDKGIGIPAGELKNIFEPFYRANNVRNYKGFGVGLPLVQKIIKLHNGDIHISSKEREGTTVSIMFPS